MDFDRPETHLQSASFRENADPITDFGDTVRQAGTEFNNFYRLVGSQIAQFANLPFATATPAATPSEPTSLSSAS